MLIQVVLCEMREIGIVHLVIRDQSLLIARGVILW